MNDNSSENSENTIDSPEKQQQQDNIDKSACDRLNNQNIGSEFTESDQNKPREFTETDIVDLTHDKNSIVRDAGEYIKNNNVDVYIDKPENFRDAKGNIDSTVIGASGSKVDEDGNLHQYIRYNEDYINKQTDDERKGFLVHEVTHLQGGDEVDSWRAEASTYSQEASTKYSKQARDICYWPDGTPKDYLTIKEELIEGGYKPEDFHS